MQKYWRACVITCFLCSSIQLFSQSAYFTVLAVHGKPVLQTTLKSDWSAIITGSRVNKNNVLKFSSGDYCALSFSDGGCLELKEPKSYGYEELIQRLNFKKQTLSKKMLDYVADNLINAKRSKEMKMLGAVVRTQKNQMQLSVPNNALLLNDIFSISWFSIGKNESYVLRLQKKDGKTVFMKLLKDTSVSVNCSEFALLPDEEYSCLVTSAGDNPFSADTVKFKIAPKNLSSAIMDTVNIEKSDTEFVVSPLKNMSVALYLERYECNFEASAFLEKAIELSMGAEGYIEHYLQFLVRTGQDKKALEFRSKYPGNAE